MPDPAPRRLTHGGKTLTLQEWAKLTGLNPETIRSRIDQQGYSVAKAITTPARAKFDPRKRVQAPAPRPCPKLRRHPNGQAYARWRAAGRDRFRYFGAHGTEAAAAAYRRFAAEWHAGPAAAGPDPGEVLTVAELVLRYLAHVDAHYVKDGKQTSERHNQRAALRVLVELYADLPAADFRPAQLRACVAVMVTKGWVRTTVNGYSGRLVKLFKWAVGQDLVHPDVPARLAEVERLRPGRSAAKDRPPVRSASPGQVEATLPHLDPDPARRAVLEAMVRTQLLTGCRPGELCGLRAADVDRAGDVWRWEVDAHKTLHRQARRRPKPIFVGPKAQAVLGPYLDAAGAGPVWVLPPAPGRTKPRLVTRLAFARFVKDACAAAKVEPWHPHRLRHTRATEVERIYESDAAAAAAIGDTPRVAAEVYVDPNEAVARRIARETG